MALRHSHISRVAWTVTVHKDFLSYRQIHLKNLTADLSRSWNNFKFRTVLDWQRMWMGSVFAKVQSWSQEVAGDFSLFPQTVTVCFLCCPRTHFTVHSVQCTFYSAQCTVQSFQCTVHMLWLTLQIIQLTMNSENCTLPSVKCTLCSAQCTVHYVHSKVYKAQFIVYTLH